MLAKNLDFLVLNLKMQIIDETIETTAAQDIIMNIFRSFKPFSERIYSKEVARMPPTMYEIDFNIFIIFLV